MNRRIEKVTFNSSLTKFGKGLFETIKVIDGKGLLLEEHLNRLFKSIEELGLATQDSEDFGDSFWEEYRALLQKDIEIACKDRDEEALRLTVCDEGYNLSFRKINYNHEDFRRGFWLCLSPVCRGSSPVYHHKTSNYLENILTLEKAKQRGFDEGLFLNTRGYVLEGAISNIFFIRGDKVHTPSVEQGILPGVMRDKVIEACNDLGIDVSCRRIEYEKAFEYGFAFITNSLLDMMKVRGIEENEYDVDLDDLSRTGKNKTEKDVFRALTRKVKELCYEG